MKKGFIRGLWGSAKINPDESKIPRRIRTDDDIAGIVNCEFNAPFKTYVMGSENYDQLSSLGLDCTLISEKEYIYDRVKHGMRHKFDIIKYAMEDDGYDQIVFLDWDCVPVKTLPDNFWKTLEKKGPFQACLMNYSRPRAMWRTSGSKTIPNGGFVYIGDKNIPQEAIRLWHETGESDNEEIAYAKMIDDRLGGWKGEDVYWDLFEPDFCVLKRKSAHSSEKNDQKNVCFRHYHGGKTIASRSVFVKEGKKFSVDKNYKEEI